MGYPANVSVDMGKMLNNAANDGRVYAVSSANFAVTSGGLYAAISLFWSAGARKVIVLSAKGQNANVSQLDQRLHRTTTDPNYSGHLISGLAIRSMLLNQPASTAALTSTTEAASNGTGTLHRSMVSMTGGRTDGNELLLKQEDYVIIPPGIAGGVLLLINGANTNGVAGEIVWAEII